MEGEGEVEGEEVRRRMWDGEEVGRRRRWEMERWGGEVGSGEVGRGGGRWKVGRGGRR